ncbi:MAG: hypothetical protein P8Y48_14305 [Novosphingobium sp.]
MNIDTKSGILSSGMCSLTAYRNFYLFIRYLRIITPPAADFLLEEDLKGSGVPETDEMTTRLTERLDIVHPMIQPPMTFAAGGPLAKAVSDAGAPGMIGGGCGDAPKMLDVPQDQGLWGPGQDRTGLIAP